MADDKDINASPNDKSLSPPGMNGDKSKKKGKGKLVFFLIFLLIAGGIAAVMVLDIGGFRENVVMPYLRNAPIIGGFIPAAEEEEEELTFEELVRRNTELQLRLDHVQHLLAAAEDHVAGYEVLRERLLAFDHAWRSYREARAQFEQTLALGDPHNFIEFFDFVSEDEQVQLYLQAREMAEFIEETQAIVATLNNMDESGAGEVLETLWTTNRDLMRRALWMMTPTRRAEIFDTLEADVVTNMIQFMSPQVPVFEIAVPPELPEFPPPPLILPPGMDLLSEDFWFYELRDSVSEEVWNAMPEAYWRSRANELYSNVAEYDFWQSFVQDRVQGVLADVEVEITPEEIAAEEDTAGEDEEE